MANLEARNHVEGVLSVAHNEPAIVGEPGIANSWRRCLVDHKLDPARRGPPRTLTQSELKRHAEPIDGLIHLATSELEDLYLAVRSTGHRAGAMPHRLSEIARLHCQHLPGLHLSPLAGRDADRFTQAALPISGLRCLRRGSTSCFKSRKELCQASGLCL